MYLFENITGERNSVLIPVMNEKISKTPVFIDCKRPIHLVSAKNYRHRLQNYAKLMYHDSNMCKLKNDVH